MDAIAAMAQSLQPGDVMLLEVEDAADTGDPPCVYAILGTGAQAGRYEWVTAESGGLRKTLQAKATFMGAMLQDDARNQAYELALNGVIGALDKESIVVVDAGAGTGLLASLACKAAARHGKQATVVALEMNPVIAGLCAATVRENALESSVIVVPQRSTSVELGVQADVVVSETMDSLLLSEGVVGTMRDALERLGCPGCMPIPCKIACVGQLVQLNDVSALHDVVCKTGGLRVPHMEATYLSSPGLHHPVLVNQLSSDVTPLSRPTVLFEVDFTSQPASKGVQERTVELELECSGTAHALLVWWTAQLADGVHVDTDPRRGYFQNHWHLGLYPLDQPAQQLDASATKRVCARVAHNGSDMNIIVLQAGEQQHAAEKRARWTDVQGNVLPLGELLSWDRAAMHRASVFARALWAKAPEVRKDDVVVDVSGLGLAQLILADEGEHYGMCSEVAAAVVARFSHVDMVRIDDVGDVGVDKAVVVVGGMPWERQLDASLALLYACQRVRGAIAAVHPARAEIAATLVRFDKLRNPLDIPRDIRGVAHGAVADAFCEHGAAVSLDLSMYDFKRVGPTHVLARLDYAARDLALVPEAAVPPFEVESANALVVWVDWFTADKVRYVPSDPAIASPAWHCDVYFLAASESSAVRVCCSVDAATRKFRVDVA